jgi:integrase
VKDGRLARNAAAGINLPRAIRQERQYLSHAEVDALAEACAALGGRPLSKHRRLSERRCEHYRLIVLFLAYAGVRFGELAALRVGRRTSAAGWSSRSRSPSSAPARSSAP